MPVLKYLENACALGDEELQVSSSQGSKVGRTAPHTLLA